MAKCPYCKSEHIARYVERRVDGEFVLDGEEVVIDGAHSNVEYIPLCEQHFLELVKKQDLNKVRRKIYGR